MPAYQYKALSEAGRATTGTVDAANAREARGKLRGQGIFVTEVHSVGGGSAASEVGRDIMAWGSKIPPRELSLVTRQLATLLGAGIPLSDSLKALAEQAESPQTTRILQGVRDGIAEGATFGDALDKYPAVFNSLYVNMVRAGEASGHLAPVVGRLAEYQEAQNRLRGKVTAALTYPVVMIFVAVGVVAFLMTFVVPRIAGVLQQQKKDLPIPTRILTTASEFTVEWWWAFLLVAALAWFALRTFRRTDKGGLAWDRLLLRLPLLGSLFRKQAISRFASTLSTLLESGIPAHAALGIVRTVVDNRVLAEVLHEVQDKILEGEDIATPIRRSGMFPPVVGYMVAVGEESGQLEDILRRLAIAYDEDIELTTQRITSLLEPILIVGMAGIVGFIVASILLPILEMSKLQR